MAKLSDQGCAYCIHKEVCAKRYSKGGEEIRSFSAAECGLYEPELVYCDDCKHQRKVWVVDKQRKNGGYFVFSCAMNDDPFVCHAVNGCDGEFCSSAEIRDER